MELGWRSSLTPCTRIESRLRQPSQDGIAALVPREGRESTPLARLATLRAGSEPLVPLDHQTYSF